jgi:hypothetical protein
MNPVFAITPWQDRWSGLPGNPVFHKYILCSLLKICVLVMAMVPAAYAYTINFEEPIANPDSVVTQYCAQGVEFIDESRIIEPPVVTMSPPRALSSDRGTGVEFEEVRKIRVAFTTGQSEVSVRVGLDRNYPFIEQGVVAYLHAYSSITADSGLITYAATNLGNQATPISQLLRVASPAGEIRSIEIVFLGADAEQGPAFEVIDDLAFNVLGPPCGGVDADTPTITIENPASDGIMLSTPRLDLAFTARDDVGISRIQVSFQSTLGNTLEYFNVCGADGTPACATPGTEIFNAFQTQLPANAHIVLIEAWDRSGKKGSASRLVSLLPPGPNMNLWAESLELTQAIQEWLPENTERRSPVTVPVFLYPAPGVESAPLIASRTTVARIYAGIEGDTSVNGVRASLRCYTDDYFTIPCAGPLVIGDDKAVIVRDSDTLDDRRRDASLSWNIVLPAEWTGAGKISLQATVNDSAVTTDRVPECSDCFDAANSIRIRSVPFYESKNFQDDVVELLRVRNTYLGTTTVPTQADLDPFLDYARRAYPVDETTVHTTYDGPFDRTQVSVDPDVECNILWGSLFFPSAGSGKMMAHGIVAKDYPISGTGSCRSLGGRDSGHGSAFTVASDGYDTFAHETGHGLGLKHPGPSPVPLGHGDECGESSWCDSDWPWPHGTFAGIGFDVMDPTLSTVILPGTTEADPHDFMSYGGQNNWISLRNWTRLFNNMTSSNLPYRTDITLFKILSEKMDTGPVPATIEAPLVSQNYLSIRGRLDPDYGWGFQPFYEDTFPVGFSDEVGVGAYEIRLVGPRNSIMGMRRFDIPVQHVNVETPSGLEIVATELSFSQHLPYPATVKDQIVAVVLYHNGLEVTRITPSSNPPVVEIVATNPTVSWITSDADHQLLVAKVEYSADAGASWHTLAVDHDSNTLPLEADLLPGSQSALVRVQVSDDLHTATAVSPAFSIPNKSPQTRIVVPGFIHFIEQGRRLILRGSASDLEDGLIPPEQITWQSSINGFIGTGRQLETTALLPGIHFVSLIAEDSTGLSSLPVLGSSMIGVVVSARPNIQPIADAGIDQETIPGDTVQLDGTASVDSDGDPLGYRWMISGSPCPAASFLFPTDIAQPSFIPGCVGHHTIELRVSDGKIESLPARVTVTAAEPIDSDEDGVWDQADNCINVINPDQRDTDGDGYGNICDPDFDNNLIVNATDLAYFKTRFFSTDPDADLNGDGIVNAGDLAILKAFFFKPPGPSGLVYP